MTMHEQYYTPEQLEQLAARREALGEEGMRKAQDDWAQLIAEVEAERENGTDPADPRVQALMERWQALIQAFTGGDPGITASLKRMYEQEGAEQASRGATSPGLQEYVGKAMAARGS
jgi:MerR family transcriptional regulator, thiopeptide resistance regulator